MKSLRKFATSAILAAGMMTGSPAAFAADLPPSVTAPEPQIAVDNPAEDAHIRDAVSAIEKAPDPSAAVEAYAKTKDRDALAKESARLTPQLQSVKAALGIRG